MTRAPGFEQIAALLEAEQERVEQLAALLVAEHDALRARDLTAMEQTARGKQALVVELDRLDRERRLWLTQARLPADSAGFGRLIAALDQDGVLAGRWEALSEKLKGCREQNLLNGRLIDPARRATQQALAILLGQESATDTYDQQGARHHTPGSRASFKV